MTYVPLTALTYWQVRLHGVAVNNQSISTAKVAIVDSGTSLLTGPSDDVDAFFAKVGARVNVYGTAVVECSELKNIMLSFSLGDNIYELSGQDITLQSSIVEEFLDSEEAAYFEPAVLSTFKSGLSICVLGLQGLDAPTPMWILGDVFMRRYAVEFDWGGKRMGFVGGKSGPGGGDLGKWLVCGAAILGGLSLLCCVGCCIWGMSRQRPRGLLARPIILSGPTQMSMQHPQMSQPLQQGWPVEQPSNSGVAISSDGRIVRPVPAYPAQ